MLLNGVLKVCVKAPSGGHRDGVVTAHCWACGTRLCVPVRTVCCARNETFRPMQEIAQQAEGKPATHQQHVEAPFAAAARPASSNDGDDRVVSEVRCTR